MISKSYVLYLDKNLWKIKFEGGGQLSEALTGSYTSKGDAEWAIAIYEASKKPSRKADRKVKDGQSEDTA